MDGPASDALQNRKARAALGKFFKRIVRKTLAYHSYKPKKKKPAHLDKISIANATWHFTKAQINICGYAYNARTKANAPKSVVGNKIES